MRFWPWKTPEPTNEDYHEMRRREDPDYDEKRRVQEIAALEAWEGA